MENTNTTENLNLDNLTRKQEEELWLTGTWEQRERLCHKKLGEVRGRKTVKKWNRRMQEVRMMTSNGLGR